MKPYYEHAGITIYHGDCREILPHVKADVLVTDPPYGIAWTVPQYNGGRAHGGIANDGDTGARDWVLAQLAHLPAAVFGSPVAQLPGGVKQVLVWAKPDNAGIFGSIGGWRRDWEAIYLMGSWPAGPAARSAIIKTKAGTATYLTGLHPHAKPVALVRQLIKSAPPGMVIDPFMGSGTTLVAAKELGCCAIGIEIEERYCEIAAKRLSQEVMQFREPCMALLKNDPRPCGLERGHTGEHAI
jgi:site-specific DNA-methyltransferase (adenine-specific)